MKSKCLVDNCEGKYKGHGYCGKHYSRFKKHGDPMKVVWRNQSSSEPKDIIERKVCSITGCDKKHKSSGYCVAHYKKLIKYNDPLKKVFNDYHFGTTEEKFNSSYLINNENGCWEWSAHRYNTGYGMISIKRKRFLAHRISYKLHYGEIPDGMVICHKCDNPPCVNPNHLFLGTHADNVNDKMAKGRYRLNKDKIHQSLTY